MQKILICTDLDRTLLPNGGEPESPGVRSLFSDFVERDDVQLAYVTGRHLGLIHECMDEYHIPTPDFAIADVGTSIYHVEDGDWHHWQPWDDEIGGDWRGLLAEQLHGLLASLPHLRLQEADKQNTHKLSYYVDLDVESLNVIAEVEARLEHRGIDAKVVWSIDEQDDVGLLDILPASASKRHAIEFLMDSGHYDSDHCVFAGDSGNDLDVFYSPIHSVAVANAAPEVFEAFAEAEPPNMYVAEGGFLGLNGCYAAGILEGVAHFSPEVRPVLEALHAQVTAKMAAVGAGSAL